MNVLVFTGAGAVKALCLPSATDFYADVVRNRLALADMCMNLVDDKRDYRDILDTLDKLANRPHIIEYLITIKISSRFNKGDYESCSSRE